MGTGDIGESSGRGRHITSHRELRVLEDGGIIIDNPGMRELGIADSGDGLDITFDSILNHARHCRYRDCTHTSEDACAVIEAVEQGKINRELYNNYLRLEREKSHFESSLAERRQKDKDFGKMVKNVKRDIKKLGKR
jgi:ribosome biogenesis GTPase